MDCTRQTKESSPSKPLVVVVGLSEYGHRVGETHHNAVISDAMVELIRDKHEYEGIGYRRLARELGLGTSIVSKICSYERRVARAVRWRKVTVCNG